MIENNAERMARAIEDVAAQFCQSPDPPCSTCIGNIFQVATLLLEHGFTFPLVEPHEVR